jgi:transposase
MPKLGPYMATLDAWLEAEEKLPAREHRTAQRMFEALRLEGYAGAVDAVRRHMREFERRRHPVATAFIPQSFDPGEAYQFDWSHEHVELGGVQQVVKVAHMRLCHSRAFFLVAYPRESQEMVFEAHARAFAFLGGVTRRGIYDNLKPAVDAIFVGRERRCNRRFLVMCNHYLIEPTACTPAAGWEKGQVETRLATYASGCSHRSCELFGGFSSTLRDLALFGECMRNCGSTGPKDYSLLAISSRSCRLRTKRWSFPDGVLGRLPA